MSKEEKRKRLVKRHTEGTDDKFIDVMEVLIWIYLVAKSIALTYIEHWKVDRYQGGHRRAWACRCQSKWRNVKRGDFAGDTKKNWAKKAKIHNQESQYWFKILLHLKLRVLSSMIYITNDYHDSYLAV